jgi:uncharacterized protein (TIGR02453 family)
MKSVLTFLAGLARNNDREWFEANRAAYKSAKEEFEGVAAKVLEGIAEFDPSVRGLELKDITYRIYRDVRFSHDKSPYKTHMGAYISRGGKKAGYAGYYFHVEPEGFTGTYGGDSGSFLTSGLYMPEGRVLKSVRWEIAENTAAFEAAMAAARGFALDRGNALRRPPKGFENVGGQTGEYLKLKDLYLTKPLGADYLTAPDLVSRVVADFALTRDFVALLNRAVHYAFEEGTDD